MVPYWYFWLIFFAHCLCVEYATITGFGNNVQQPNLQSILSPYLRVGPTTYIDNVEEIDTFLPNERFVSNQVFGTQTIQDPARNLLLVALGQFISHDTQRTSSENPISGLEEQGESVVIPIPIGDPWFDPQATGEKFFSFVRVNPVVGTGSGTGVPKAILNHVTPLLDLSPIYSSTEDTLEKLRNATHPAFLNQAQTKNTKEWMLPFNEDINVPILNPLNLPQDRLYSSGDSRVNQNPLLAAMHGLFALEHNRLAEELSKKNRNWSQDKLFYEARRRNIAQYQAITLNEYVPIIIGEPLPEYEEYNDTLSTSPSLLFNAAFRVGHACIAPEILFYTESRELLTSVRFRDTYFRADIIDSLGLGNLLRGLMIQPQTQFGVAYIDDIRNFLFGRPGSGGIDLAALSLFRERDLGLPFYNDARDIFGLSRVESFDEVVSDKYIVQILEELYGHPDNAEVFTVGLAEDSEGRVAGPLFSRIIAEQFVRTRGGDRFYFENSDAGFDDDDIDEISRTTIADIILRNTNVHQLQCSAMFLSNSLDCGEDPVEDDNLLFDLNIELLDGKIVLSWEISDDTISFAVKGSTEGWIGIGLASNPGNMVGADAMIGTVSGSNVAIGDYKITARNVGCKGVCLDEDQGGNNDLFDISGSQSRGITYLKWSRLLNTKDSEDEEIVDDGNSTPIVFAMSNSNSDTLAYHQNNKGAAEVNFFTGEFEITNVETNQGAEDRLIVHGVLMFVAWAVIFPLGVVAVKFCRKIFPRWWFRLHMFLQYFGVLVIIVALILAVEAVADMGDRKHINNAHAIMGIISVSLAIIIPALGQATAVMFEAPKRVPIFPDRAHSALGYIGPFVAYATMFLGLYEKDAAWYWYLIMAIYLFVITVAYWAAFIFQLVHQSYQSKKNLKANAAISAEEAEDSWSSDDE